MTDLKDNFEIAVKNSKELKQRPDNETLLNLYSLFKQATEGDTDPANKPAMFDFVAQAKYNAWMALKGKSSADAMQAYVSLVNELSKN
jgi:acyl-CoA-binding protein